MTQKEEEEEREEEKEEREEEGEEEVDEPSGDVTISSRSPSTMFSSWSVPLMLRTKSRLVVTFLLLSTQKPDDMAPEASARSKMKAGPAQLGSS